MINCCQFSCENVDLLELLKLRRHQDEMDRKNLNVVDDVVSCLYVVALQVAVEVLDVDLRMGMVGIEVVAANVV